MLSRTPHASRSAHALVSRGTRTHQEGAPDVACANDVGTLAVYWPSEASRLDSDPMPRRSSRRAARLAAPKDGPADNPVGRQSGHTYGIASTASSASVSCTASDAGRQAANGGDARKQERPPSTRSKRPRAVHEPSSVADLVNGVPPNHAFAPRTSTRGSPFNMHGEAASHDGSIKSVA